MICPRCELGNLRNIRFIQTGKKARLCDICEALWLEGENNVRNYFSYTGQIFTTGEAEYTIDTTEEEDQEYRSVNYTDFK